MSPKVKFCQHLFHLVKNKLFSLFFSPHEPLLHQKGVNISTQTKQHCHKRSKMHMYSKYVTKTNVTCWKSPYVVPSCMCMDIFERHVVKMWNDVKLSETWHSIHMPSYKITLVCHPFLIASPFIIWHHAMFTKYTYDTCGVFVYIYIQSI